jgi:hypothetical protein
VGEFGSPPLDKRLSVGRKDIFLQARGKNWKMQVAFFPQSHKVQGPLGSMRFGHANHWMAIMS